MYSVTIIIDPREQAPLPFSLPTEWGTLATRNYSIKGLEWFEAVECKSPGDLAGCLKSGQGELSHSPVKSLTNSTGT